MQNSKIEWTDHTFNPWEGCTRVSPGCANCYAETRNQRFAGGANFGPGAPRRRTSAANWRQPLKWDREAAEAYNDWAGHETLHGGNPRYAEPRRPRVFCASLADWLDDEVPIEWLADLLDLIRRTPNLDWLLLTKRPQNWDRRLRKVHELLCFPTLHSPDEQKTRNWCYYWLNGAPPQNVWIGTTVEDQARADERIPHLLSIPARVRFLSCEPLLGPVRLPIGSVMAGFPRHITAAGHAVGAPLAIHWVICGGESGPKARPMHPDWARSLRDQCAAAGVPFLFKQWGEWTPGENLERGGRLPCAYFAGDRWDFSTQTDKQSENCHADDSPDVYRVGKAAAGRLLDGKEHNEFPTP